MKTKNLFITIIITLILPIAGFAIIAEPLLIDDIGTKTGNIAPLTGTEESCTDTSCCSLEFWSDFTTSFPPNSVIHICSETVTKTREVTISANNVNFTCGSNANSNSVGATYLVGDSENTPDVGIRVTGDNVVIENCHVSNYPTGILLSSTALNPVVRAVNVSDNSKGLTIQTSNAIIESSKFSHNSIFGVNINGYNNALIKNNKFEDNSGTALNLFGTTDTTVISNTFTDNADSINIQSSNSPILKRNLIKRSSERGIVVESTTYTLIKNNFVLESVQTGIEIGNSATNTVISENTIRDTHSAIPGWGTGILFSGEGAQLIGNYICNNTFDVSCESFQASTGTEDNFCGSSPGCAPTPEVCSNRCPDPSQPVEPNQPVDLSAGEYVCGDFNWDQQVDISDLVAMVSYLFFENSLPPVFPTAANVDGITGVDAGTYDPTDDPSNNLDKLGDLGYLVEYMFLQGPAPICYPTIN